MSQYVEFFVRGGDTFYPIASYSRSNGVYQRFNSYLPYEKIGAIDTSMLANIREDVKADKEHCLKNLESLKFDIELVTKMDASLDEKMSYIHDREEWIEDCEETLRDYDHVISFTWFLEDILEEVQYGSYSPCEDGPAIDPKKYLYGGIEAGRPTLNDIIGEENERD